MDMSQNISLEDALNSNPVLILADSKQQLIEGMTQLVDVKLLAPVYLATIKRYSEIEILEAISNIRVQIKN